MSTGAIVGLSSMRWGLPGGPRVLLVHGLSASGAGWWRVASVLAEAGCEVVAPDLRGHGSSPGATSYAFPDHVADLAALGGRWDLVVGHSLAGPIVTRLARRTETVDRVLLLDPVFEIDDGVLDEVVADQVAEVGADASAASFQEQHPAWHPDDCFHKAAAARATSPHVVERCLRDNAPYHHLGDLTGVDVPVVVLGADPDLGALFHEKAAAEVTSPSFTCRVLDGVGHAIHREVPDVVVQAARALLETSPL